MAKKKQADTPMAGVVDSARQALEEVEASTGLSESAKSLITKALAVQLELGQRMMAHLCDLENEIKSLQFGTRAQRALLAMDVARLPLVSDPEIREKILDRTHAALKSKPPSPPPPVPSDNTMIHDGKVIGVPSKFEDVEL